MTAAVKGTGTAALIAAGLVVTVQWVLKQYGGVDIPSEVVQADQALLTVLLAYFVHDRGVQ